LALPPPQPLYELLIWGCWCSCKNSNMSVRLPPFLNKLYCGGSGGICVSCPWFLLGVFCFFSRCFSCAFEGPAG
jgi:hypothetical protein